MANVRLPKRPDKPLAYGELGGLRVIKTIHGDGCDMCIRSGGYMVQMAGWTLRTYQGARIDNRARFCAGHVREMVRIWERKGKEEDGSRD